MWGIMENSQVKDLRTFVANSLKPPTSARVNDSSKEAIRVRVVTLCYHKTEPEVLFSNLGPIPMIGIEWPRNNTEAGHRGGGWPEAMMKYSATLAFSLSDADSCAGIWLRDIEGSLEYKM